VAGRRARAARRSRPRSQHFLHSRALAAEIVRDACVGPDDLVLELGAGSGRLTSELARVARRAVAVELDPRWADALRDRWPNVDVVEADAAEIAFPNEPFKVVANLPFDRTTDFLRLLFDDPLTALLRADLIVEWGVALKRGIPWPSTVNGVAWGAFYETTIARRVPRLAFDPPPAVDAGVLVFRRRASPLVPREMADTYRRFIARAFRHGVGSVAPAYEVRRIAGAGARARDLDAHQWAALFTRRFSSAQRRQPYHSRG
jgi:23S rRNA (adenine-N6)-dimethyltransferase